MRLLFLWLLLAPTWTTSSIVYPVRYGDVEEIRTLLQTLVPDVTYEVVRRPPGLRCTGPHTALEQVAELLAEIDRPPEVLELQLSLVDTRGLLGSTDGTFALQVMDDLSTAFVEVYAWPTTSTDSDRDICFELSDGPEGLRLDLKPSVKADGYVIFELRPEVTTGEKRRSINTSMRVAPGEVILLGGVFGEANRAAASQLHLAALEPVLNGSARPSDLAVAIRWRVKPHDPG